MTTTPLTPTEDAYIHEATRISLEARAHFDAKWPTMNRAYTRADLWSAFQAGRGFPKAKLADDQDIIP